MAFNFKQAALDRSAGSRLSVGRNKVEMEDLIAGFPEGITIEEFDILEGSEGTYAVCTFKEDPAAFFFGGSVMTSLCEYWVSQHESDDCEVVSDDLKAQGGVRVKIEKAKSKKTGRYYNNVVIPE